MKKSLIYSRNILEDILWIHTWNKTIKSVTSSIDLIKKKRISFILLISNKSRSLKFLCDQSQNNDRMRMEGWITFEKFFHNNISKTKYAMPRLSLYFMFLLFSDDNLRNAQIGSWNGDVLSCNCANFVFVILQKEESVINITGRTDRSCYTTELQFLTWNFFSQWDQFVAKWSHPKEHLKFYQKYFAKVWYVKSQYTIFFWKKEVYHITMLTSQKKS